MSHMQVSKTVTMNRVWDFGRDVPHEADAIVEQLSSEGFYNVLYKEVMSKASFDKVFDFIKKDEHELLDISKITYGPHLIVCIGVFNNYEVVVLLSTFSLNDGYHGINIYSDDPDISSRTQLAKIFDDSCTIEKQDKVIFTNYYIDGHNNLRSCHISVNKKNLSNFIPELYPTIDTDILIAQYLESYEPILILAGQAGTGKTTIIKRIHVQNNFNNSIYVKDIKVLKDPGFWTNISNEKHENSILILDDLDEGLEPRNNTDKEHNTIISNILSFTDGVFTKSSNKVIITTNTKCNRIDPALIRSGRAFDFIELVPMDREYAKNIWTKKLRQTEESFDLTFKGPKVCQSDMMSALEKIDNMSIERTYNRVGPTRYLVHEKLEQLGLVKKEIPLGTKPERKPSKKVVKHSHATIQRKA